MIPRFYRLLKYTPASEIRPVAEVSRTFPIGSSFENDKGDLGQELLSRQSVSRLSSQKESKLTQVDETSFYTKSEHVQVQEDSFSVAPFWRTEELQHFLSSRWMLAYDGSEEASKTWLEANQLSKLFKSKLSGIFIQTSPKLEMKIPKEIEIIRSNVIVKTILEEAIRRKVSLIWLGTHARRGKERVKKGSVAESVMKEALCPVWVDKKLSENKIKNILLPFDNLKNLESMLQQIVPLSHVLHSNLYLLHVSGEKMLDPLKQIFLKLNLQNEYETLEKQGSVEEIILQTAKEKEIDLIVMATHYEKVESEILPTGLSVEIMREAPCSLLVLKHL